MKKSFLCSLVTAGLLLSGCGSSNTTNQDPTYTDITVERGPVIGAYVVDNSGKRAVNLGNGQYRFSVAPTYPITAYGGYIDVNRDGVIDGNDTTLTMSLFLGEQNRNKLTIVTTLATNEELKNKILTTYGLSEEELFTLTPSTSLKISAISDEVFKYCIENNSSVEDINMTTFTTLENEINSTIVANETLALTQTLLEIATQNETDLVNELNVTLTDTDANLSEVALDITQSSTQTNDPTAMLDAMPLYPLSDEQKAGLVFMYQEEKVARDVYNAMYTKWGSKVFANIAKSEQSHMDAVKAILEKYSLEVPSDEAGVFTDSDLLALYNTLIGMGNVSSNEAMKVGVLVEETDIADLIERMVDAPDDIEIVYQNLLNGSYNHLNAFSKQVY